ncbi:MAG TPA: Ig-like domain-containing protein, partial [Paludibacter sp.]
MKKNKLLTTLAIIMVVLLAGCKKDDYVETIGVCPLVISTDPANAINSVPYNKVISAKFNEKMDGATINESSFILQQGNTTIEGTVSYSDSTAKFTPSAALLPLTTYKGTIRKTAKDLLGNFLQADYVWTFTTMPQITLISSPVIGGSTVGGGAYAVGAIVTVTATPLPGYAFVNWT